MDVKNNKLHEGKGTFLIDTGSELNLLKGSCIDGKLRRDRSDIFNLSGIGQGTLKTRGSVLLKILGKLVKFHVVRNNFPISTCGILGMEFLRENLASLKFSNEEITLNLPESNKVSPCVINLPARVRKYIKLPIENTDLKEGYLESIEAGTGVYLGENLVKCTDGHIKVFAINTTHSDIQITIPPIKLQEFEIPKIVESNSLSKKREPENPPEKSPVDRISNLLKIFNFSHLNEIERDSLLDPISEYSHRFYLEGDVLGATDVITHEIHTTDETPIFHKQYRQAEIHNDDTSRQTKSLLTNKIIEDSDSPYNSPVWIVPKKPDPDGNKRWRMVIDFRQLNEKTIKDVYPLPNITHILDQLGGVQYFSTLDLAMGFHQI